MWEGRYSLESCNKPRDPKDNLLRLYVYKRCEIKMCTTVSEMSMVHTDGLAD